MFSHSNQSYRNSLIISLSGKIESKERSNICERQDETIAIDFNFQHLYACELLLYCCVAVYFKNNNYIHIIYDLVQLLIFSYVCVCNRYGIKK